jgi:hypothetical protein
VIYPPAPKRDQGGHPVAELGVAPYGLDLVGVETGPDVVLELACSLAEKGACS